MKKITYNKQFIDSKDIKLVAKSLKSDFITSGKEVENFEKKISKYLKVKYSVSCINGTAGLDLAFKSIWHSYLKSANEGDISMPPQRVKRPKKKNNCKFLILMEKELNI